jgi:hypothetical protein
VASVKQFQVTFDCAEPERVARFWCEVLGYVVPPPPEGFAASDDFGRSLPPEDQGSAFACIDPSGVGPRLFFQRVPEGKVVKNRLHLDVRVGTGLVAEERLAALEAECARLVALGAVRVRLLPADEDNESCIVMQDIEGNEYGDASGCTHASELLQHQAGLLMARQPELLKVTDSAGAEGSLAGDLTWWDGRAAVRHRG